MSFPTFSDPSSFPLASEGTGPRAFGLGDIETGVKFRFIQEAKHRPMVGTFTMFEIPSGDPTNGLGVGKGWAKLPVWARKKPRTLLRAPKASLDSCRISDPRTSPSHFSRSTIL